MARELCYGRGTLGILGSRRDCVVGIILASLFSCLYLYCFGESKLFSIINIIYCTTLSIINNLYSKHKLNEIKSSCNFLSSQNHISKGNRIGRRTMSIKYHILGVTVD